MSRPPLTYTPFYPEHLQRLKPHPMQQDEYNALLSMYAYDNLSTCIGLTAWAGAACVGVAGLFQIWDNRAEAWVVFSEDARHYLVQAAPKLRYMLDSVPFRRIEMCVKVHNVKGHRLASALGFSGRQNIKLPDGSVVSAEGYLEAYWPSGDESVDAVIYARIKRP